MKIVVKNVESFNIMLIRRGFSKRRFAKTAGVSAPLINQISNGVRNPGPETARKISEALQVEFDDLFTIVKSPVAPQIHAV